MKKIIVIILSLFLIACNRNINGSYKSDGIANVYIFDENYNQYDNFDLKIDINMELMDDNQVLLNNKEIGIINQDSCEYDKDTTMHVCDIVFEKDPISFIDINNDYEYDNAYIIHDSSNSFYYLTTWYHLKQHQQYNASILMSFESIK